MGHLVFCVLNRETETIEQNWMKVIVFNATIKVLSCEN